MQVALLHPGTQHAFGLAAELYRRSILSALYTGFAIGDNGVAADIYQRLPERWHRRLSNRRINGLPARLIHQQPLLEIATICALGRVSTPQNLHFRRNRTFQNRISDSALLSADVVMGFDTSSWILARRCRDLGRPFVLIQTTPHPDSKTDARKDIVARFPEWTVAEEHRQQELREAEQLEHQIATQIVAASSFSRLSLERHGVDGARIHVIPHGVDCLRFNCRRSVEKRPFRFVFAGAITSTKGIPLLLKAWETLNFPDAELWIVGPVSPKVQNLLPTLNGLRYVPAVPHSELPEIFNQSDVFVFPSLFDGFGLVILEAMASGIPVITTDATAGPDIIQDGITGWVHKAGDFEALCQNIETAYRNQLQCIEMGRKARIRAEEFTWQHYGDLWESNLSTIATNKIT